MEKVDIDPQVAIIFTELNMKRLHRFMIVKMEEGIPTLEHTGERNATFEDFAALMPKNEPRWAIIDLEIKSGDGRVENKIVFFMYAPDSCSNGKDKFAYAHKKDIVKAKMSPVHKELQVNDHGDLTYDRTCEEF